MENDKPAAVSYSDIAPRAFVYRGAIINEAIYLERLNDEYLGRHFCPDKEKRAELFELILATERITFENKRQVLKFLLDKHYKNIVDALPEMFKELTTIIEFRNYLAHQMLDTSEAGLKVFQETDTIRLVRFKNSTSYIDIAPNKIDEIKQLTAKYIQVFLTQILRDEK